jgi:sugar transferase (PEP-CTERM/EpsH1 system associated)
MSSGSRLRVVFLCHRLPYAPNRGDRIRAYHMLEQMRRDADVHVVSFVHDRAEAIEAHRVPADRVTVLPTAPWRNRLRALALLGTDRPLTHLLLDAPGAAAAVDHAIRTTRPDVLVAYCSGVARLALTPEAADLPLVVDMVDVDSAKWRALAPATPQPMRWIYQREARCLGAFERALVARAATTLVVNERERSTLADMVPGARVSVIENGIDLERFRPPADEPRQPHVVFCGVMNYAPNEEAALRLIRDIWPRVRTARPDARLVLVGAHPTSRMTAAAAADRSIDVTGSVADVRPYLWRAAVSAAPLRTARGLQNKVLEALAARLPVVTTPAVAEGLPGSALPGCLVAADDGEAAAALVRLLGLSDVERKQMAGRSDLSGLTWDRQMASLMPTLAAACHGWTRMDTDARMDTDRARPVRVHPALDASE